MSVQTFIVNYQRRRRARKLAWAFDIVGYQALRIGESLKVIKESHGFTEALENIAKMCVLYALMSASLKTSMPDDATTRIAKMTSEQVKTLGIDIDLIDKFLKSTQSVQVPMSLPTANG